VHVPSWDSAAADTLWTGACGKPRWRGTLESVEDDLKQLSDETLWRFRGEGRRQLIDFLRQRLVRQHRGRGAARARIRECDTVLDPDALTLGFARRFAEYKRPNLLLHEPERLVRLLTNRDHPVQLVIAGKAHPKDNVGKRLLRQWQDFIETNGMHERVVFVEDYDLGVAAKMTQGVDVWINTPRRPWEASGTSGMKILVNGGLNLSELDGWWAEAYAPELGWAIGDGLEHTDIAAWDAEEAKQLYRLLENEVVPCFYQREVNGLPSAWVGRMRESMGHLTSQFSTPKIITCHWPAPIKNVPIRLPLSCRTGTINSHNTGNTSILAMSPQPRQKTATTLKCRYIWMTCHRRRSAWNSMPIRPKVVNNFARPWIAESCSPGRPMPMSIKVPRQQPGLPQITHRE
jgi:starch phosphorylase